MTDVVLLGKAVEVALGISSSVDRRLMSGIIIPDIPGWSARGRALRFELQIRDAALWATDALEWGARSMAGRLSPIGMSCARFIGEIAAEMSWLAEPGEDDARQKRAFERHLDALGEERRMLGHIQRRERSASKHAANDVSLRTIQLMESAIHNIAEGRGQTPLEPMPERIELFDSYLQDLNGYGFFALTSTVGSHPGLSMGALLANAGDTMVTNMSRDQVPLLRAFVVMAQMRAFRHVVQIASQALNLDVRFGDELAKWLDNQREIDVAISARFAEVTWPKQAT